MAYISYFQFLSELKQIINDVKLDIKLEGLKGEEFDSAYNGVITRLSKRCKDFADNSFRGKSKFIGNYIAEIRATKSYPQFERFEKLLDVTDEYIKKSV